jgi:WD40 repeat protein
MLNPDQDHNANIDSSNLNVDNLEILSANLPDLFQTLGPVRSALTQELVAKIKSLIGEDSETLERKSSLLNRLQDILDETPVHFPLFGQFRAADVVTSIGLDSEILALSISRDGKFLAVSEISGVVRVIALRERTDQGWLRQCFLHQCVEDITRLALHPSGRWLAVGGRDQNLKIFDISFEIGQGSSRNLSDEKRGADSLNQLKLISNYCAADEITSIATSPNGSLLAIGTARGVITIFSVSDRGELKSIIGEVKVGSFAPLVTFMADGETFAVGGYRTEVYNIWHRGSDGDLIPLWQRKGYSRALAFSADGQFVAVSGGIGFGQIIEILSLRGISSNGFPETVALFQAYRTVEDLVFSPDGLHLGAVLTPPDRYAQFGEVVLVDTSELYKLPLPTSKTLWLKQVGHVVTEKRIRDISFSGGGECLAVGGDDKIVWIFGMRDPYLEYEI